MLLAEFAGRGPESDHSHYTLLEVDVGQLI